MFKYVVAFEVKTGRFTREGKTETVFAIDLDAALDTLRTSHGDTFARYLSSDCEKLPTATLFVINLHRDNAPLTVCQTYASRESMRVAMARDYPSHEIDMVTTHDLINVNIHDMQAGDRVFMGMALFQVIEAYTVPRDERDIREGYSDERGVAVRLANWECGWVEPGYYGPAKGWNFQGNHRVSHWIVAR